MPFGRWIKPKVLPGHKVEHVECDRHEAGHWRLVCGEGAATLFFTRRLADFYARTQHVNAGGILLLVNPSPRRLARFFDLHAAEVAAGITAEAVRAAKHFEDMGGGDAA